VCLNRDLNPGPLALEAEHLPQDHSLPLTWDHLCYIHPIKLISPHGVWPFNVENIAHVPKWQLLRYMCSLLFFYARLVQWNITYHLIKYIYIPWVSFNIYLHLFTHSFNFFSLTLLLQREPFRLGISVVPLIILFLLISSFYLHGVFSLLFLYIILLLFLQFIPNAITRTAPLLGDVCGPVNRFYSSYFLIIFMEYSPSFLLILQFLLNAPTRTAPLLGDILWSC